ncbi:MAG TPA: ribonuclease P protein component [Candidatus Cloacimonadota bacterium]|nr:ribonuclease P protein component [Candidatus Cloacimonadota bacterium]HPS38480.1 ribonuclease P protein component [Candidatus Cloacimonadota bacterium]
MLRRITRHQEYETFFQPSYIVRTAHFLVPALASEDCFALGITISKKIGNAVCRNRLRRRIKSWFQQRNSLPRVKINLVARKGAGVLSWDELCLELDHMLLGLEARSGS